MDLLKAIDRKLADIDKLFPQSPAIAPPPIANTDNPWHEDPLPLAEFVESDRHLSSNGQKLQLWDTQRRDLEAFLGTDPKRLFDEDSPTPYNEAFFLWGKGSGKDFCVALVQCWVSHVLLCLKNPQEYLGIASGEAIDIPVIAYNQLQSRTVYFTKFKQRLRNWNWLRDTIDRLRPDVGCDRWLKESGGYVNADYIELPHHIKCWSLPSTPASGEGKNVIFWVLDELAAFASDRQVDRAKQIHNMVVSSARTRFRNRWKGFAISFPRHRADYMMQMRDRALRGELTRTFVSVHPTWEVNPNVTREDFAEDYARDPEGSRCKYECDPPSAVDAYFRSPELILLHASGAPLPLLDQYLVEVPEGQRRAIASLGLDAIARRDVKGDPILNRYGFPDLQPWFKGQSKPSGDRYEYLVHLDPGLSGDAFGFAMGHLHQLPSGGLLPAIDLAFRWTGAMFRDRGEVWRGDWSLHGASLEEVTAAEVDFRTVREFVVFLRSRLNFNIIQVSADGWNSAESLQEIRKADIPVGNHLVLKADYDEFKALVYNRQLQYYGSRILYEECAKLQIVNGTRVDAPRTREGDSDRLDSHKDVSDAVAAVCWYLARMKDDGIDFAQVEIPSEPEPTSIELGGGSEFNAEQHLILQEFF